MFGIAHRPNPTCFGVENLIPRPRRSPCTTPSQSGDSAAGNASGYFNERQASTVRNDRSCWRIGESIHKRQTLT